MKKAFLIAALTMSLSACSLFGSQDNRNLSEEWSDSKLSSNIAGLVNQPAYVGKARVNGIAYNGQLLLVGQAETEALKQAFIEDARLIDGVTRIYDQIYVKPPIELGQVTKDSWITTKVKSAFIAAPDFYSADVKVITEDGNVYLLGYVTETQGNQAIEIARNIDGVKQVITLFVQ